MTLQGSEFKKAALLGLILAVLPLFLYPYTFGLSATTHGTPSLFLFEPLYYALVLYAISRRKNASQIASLVAVGMGFRLAVGFISAMLMTGIFNLGLGAALKIALFAYLPGALVQMAVIPFIVKPLVQVERRRPRPRVRPTAPEVQTAEPRTAPATESHSWSPGGENLPDFDAAVSHIASFSSVEIAVLVDQEGLPLARACREGADWELWSPVVNRLYDAIKQELQRTEYKEVQQFDLILGKHRLSVIALAPFFLCVLYDHTTDDMVTVRIAQAVEMVKKYREQRYPMAAPPVATEVAYV